MGNVYRAQLYVTSRSQDGDRQTKLRPALPDELTWVGLDIRAVPFGLEVGPPQF